MDPDREDREDDVGHECAKNAEDHDIREVLEEPLPSHIVARGKYDRWDAEVE